MERYVSVLGDDRPIRIMLVGCGRISERHIDAITSNAKLELVAVCDEVPDRAKAAGEKAGVPFFTSYEKMLDTAKADVVAICTPSGMHPRQGIMAAERGLHVICEKPLAISEEECLRMISACDEAGVRLMTAYRLHFEPVNLQVVKLIEQGKKRL